VEITEVRVKLMDESGERLRACCSITFDDAFVIRDLKIIEGASGLFVAMPARKLTTHCPQCNIKNHLRAAYCNQCGRRLNEPSATKGGEGPVKLYADIAHPTNSAFRKLIEQRVIQAFKEEKARSQMAGYKPSYDEFESETLVSCVASRIAAIAPPEANRSEKPRNPNTTSSHQPQSAGHPDSFGAGILD
jgi:stage V sporulation protein G